MDGWRHAVLTSQGDSAQYGSSHLGISATIKLYGVPKGSDLISSLRTSWDKLQAQKSPQGLRRAGS